MIELLDLGPDVLAYRAAGRMERADIDLVFAELDRKLAGGGKIRVYAEVESFSGMTPDALWRDIVLGVRRLDAVPRIEKAALVTDIEWMSRAARVENRVFPGVEILSFRRSEAAAAREWLQLANPT